MDFSALVGLPWLERGRSLAGCDCYGLIYIAYRDLLGIVLPDYDQHRSTAEDQAEIERIVRGGPSAWRPVVAGAERAFDAVLVRCGGVDEHVGCVVRRGQMLHMRVRGTSGIERYPTNPYPARITGFFRHEALA